MADPLRILLTADPEIEVPPRLYGGIERIVDMLVRGLRARGHEVGLVARAGSTAPASALFEWGATRSRGVAGALRNIATLHRAAVTFRPHVLHSFSRLLYMTTLYRFRDLPKIMSYQRRPSARTVTLAHLLAGGSLQFTGCSEHICAQGRSAAGNWTAIFNGVDVDRYTFRAEVPTDAPLVFLSRVERIKGAHTAIEMARRCGRRLVIAGNHATEGEAGQYWETCIAPQIGHDGIAYAGPVDDAAKDRLLGGAAAMLVPIEWDEPFGIVFAEALACGTPVISSPRGALPEIVRPGVDGFLVRSVEEGCGAIEQLGSIDRRACRARAEQTFSAPVIVEAYERLYRRLSRVER